MIILTLIISIIAIFAVLIWDAEKRYIILNILTVAGNSGYNFKPVNIGRLFTINTAEYYSLFSKYKELFFKLKIMIRNGQ